MFIILYYTNDNIKTPQPVSKSEFWFSLMKFNLRLRK